ncbi:MAG: SCP2 sterol-binding domain-containing protein [Candidatus Hodarchaeota archaeon]
MSLTCTSCGKIVETLPLQCGYSINVNYDTNQWECYMEDCGTISINEFICSNCCTNKNILKINKAFEQLSLENDEFKDELTYFKKNVVQINLTDSNFNYWVEFGNGVYTCGKGVKENPSIIVSCPQKTMNQILKGNLDPFSEFFVGKVKIEGDLQYAVVYFDLIKLASEIGKELGGASFE